MAEPTMNSETGHQADDGHPVPAVGHVVPIRILATVAAALLVFTVVTVWVSLYDLGPLNLFVALLIATIKASLVVLYFMHLRYDRPFNAIILISSIVFVALFIGLAMMDSFAYQSDLLGGEAPEILRGIAQ